MLAFRLVACLLVPLLAVTTLPALGSPAAGARLEGLVHGVDGRPASGYRVHLIDEEGRGLAESTVDGSGGYAFTSLSAGDYSLGLENRSGEIAAVVTRPIELGHDELARRDIRLMGSDADTVNGALAANASLGSWWGDLTHVGKVWTVVGLVGFVALAASALDDDNEVDATPTTP